jgi:hypothetical protein
MGDGRNETPRIRPVRPAHVIDTGAFAKKIDMVPGRVKIFSATMSGLAGIAPS